MIFGILIIILLIIGYTILAGLTIRLINYIDCVDMDSTEETIIGMSWFLVLPILLLHLLYLYVRGK